MSAIFSGASNMTYQTPQMQSPDTTSDALRIGHHHHGGGAKFKQAFAAAAAAVGVDPAKIPDLQKQIQQAIQDARKNGGNGDPRQTIQDAVNGVLKQNGIDPAAFDDALKAQFQKMADQRKSGQSGNNVDPETIAAPPTTATTSASNLIDTTA